MTRLGTSFKMRCFTAVSRTENFLSQVLLLVIPSKSAAPGKKCGSWQKVRVLATHGIYRYTFILNITYSSNTNCSRKQRLLTLWKQSLASTSCTTVLWTRDHICPILPDHSRFEFSLTT